MQQPEFLRQEIPEQPQLPQFVDATVTQFLSRKTKLGTDEPYMLDDAASDVIDASGLSPMLLLGHFMQQTSLDPKSIGDFPDPLLHPELTWEQVSHQLATSILMWETDDHEEVRLHVIWREHAYHRHAVLSKVPQEEYATVLHQLEDRERELIEEFGPNPDA